VLCANAALAQESVGPRDASVVASGGVGAAIGLATLGDLDGDGVDDLLAGCFGCPGIPVHSGADGSVLRWLTPPAVPTTEFFGVLVGAAGDLNGDGAPDALVVDTIFDAGGNRLWRLHAFDGAGATLLWTRGGFAGPVPLSLVALPDIDADGVADIAIGRAADASGAPAVRAFSGADGGPLWSAADANALSLGQGLALVPDLDGDGLDDLAASALGSAGGVALLSSATGAEIRRIANHGVAGAFGAALARIGDLDGDGVDELAIGDSAYRVDALRVGRVTAHALADGALLREWTSPNAASAAFGRTLGAIDDLDGDGRAELAIGDPFFAGEDLEIPPIVTLHPNAQAAPSLIITGESIDFARAITSMRAAGGRVGLAVAAPAYRVPASGGNFSAQILVFDPSEACAGDLRIDGVIDGIDLGALLGAWGMPWVRAPRADIDRNGVVGSGDIGALLANWGLCAN
jgi:hypothetical protein